MFQVAGGHEGFNIYKFIKFRGQIGLFNKFRGSIGETLNLEVRWVKGYKFRGQTMY